MFVHCFYGGFFAGFAFGGFVVLDFGRAVFVFILAVLGFFAGLFYADVFGEVGRFVCTVWYGVISLYCVALDFTRGVVGDVLSS